MTYIHGFVLPVPTGSKEEYLALAARMVPIFRDHGALRVVECWGDDVPPGKVTDFPGAVKARDDETVVFSWVEWPSKAARDEAGPRIMADPRMPAAADMPFDGRRLIHGGFAVILDDAGGTP